jgi:hypothetical protein
VQHEAPAIGGRVELELLRVERAGDVAVRSCLQPGLAVDDQHVERPDTSVLRSSTTRHGSTIDRLRSARAASSGDPRGMVAGAAVATQRMLEVGGFSWVGRLLERR